MAHSTTIDKAGRVVIPKPLRDLLRLAPGDPIEIEASNGVISLRPLSEPATLVKEQGVWVYRGRAGEIDVTEAIGQSREDRLDDVAR